jgi:hypothetical protein
VASRLGTVKPLTFFYSVARHLLICEPCDECHGETEGGGHGSGGREELGRPQGGGGTAGQGEDSRQAAPSTREAAQGLFSVLKQEISDTLIFFTFPPFFKQTGQSRLNRSLIDEAWFKNLEHDC